MNLSIKSITIDKAGAVARRGFPQASQYLAQRVKAYCDPYVPMQTGTLKNTAFCGENYVRYDMPYAHFQYHGVVMVGVVTHSPWAKRGEAKRYTGKPLSYSGGGQRGANWDKRMMAQRGSEVTQDIASFLGGRKG